MKRIKDIADVANHVGATHDTIESIARRVYKDTENGCPASVEKHVVNKKKGEPQGA